MSNFSNDINKIAKLAAIKINDAEKESYSKELDMILKMIDELHTVETEGVEPLRSIASGSTPLREDVALNSPQDDIISSTQYAKYDYFIVPKFVE